MDGQVAGWIYALRSASLPGLLKIGHTTYRPDDRVLQYNTLVGIVDGLATFEVAWGERVKDSADVEGRIHHALVSRRIRMDREFFRVNLEELWEVAERIVGRVVSRDPWTRPLTYWQEAQERKRVKFRVPEFYDWLVENRARVSGFSTDQMVDTFYRENGRTYCGRDISPVYALCEWGRVRAELDAGQTP